MFLKNYAINRKCLPIINPLSRLNSMYGYIILCIQSFFFHFLAYCEAAKNIIQQLALKYDTPPTDPSFLPTGSSSTTPAHSPGANFVSPKKSIRPGFVPPTHTWKEKTTGKKNLNFLPAKRHSRSTRVWQPRHLHTMHHQLVGNQL